MNEDIRELLARGASDAVDTDMVPGVWQQAQRHRRNRNLGVASLAAAGVALTFALTQSGTGTSTVLPAGRSSTPTESGPAASSVPLTETSVDNCGNPQDLPAELDQSEFGGRLLTDDPGEEVTVAVDIANVLDTSMTVQVDIDGKSALSVRVPATASDCYLMFRYGLEVPTGPTDITVSTDSGHTDQMTFDVTGEISWVVVQVQDGFPLELEVHDEPPGWG